MKTDTRLRPSDIAKKLNEAAESHPGRKPRADPDYDWEGRYKAVFDFAVKNGHTRVSPDSEWNGKNIGHFVRNHRVWFNEEALSSEKIAKIEEIPHWVWNPGNHDWHANYETFERAMTTVGVSALRKHSEFEGFRTGAWAKNQRDRFKAGSLSDAQIEMLISIPGWSWDLRAAKKAARDRRTAKAPTRVGKAK